MPGNVKDYIVSLYGNLRGKIRTSNWVSEEFSFDKGVFHGKKQSGVKKFLNVINVFSTGQKQFIFAYD